jgi:hypothetical protein
MAFLIFSSGVVGDDAGPTEEVAVVLLATGWLAAVVSVVLADCLAQAATLPSDTTTATGREMRMGSL